MKQRTQKTLVSYCEKYGIDKMQAMTKTAQAIRHYGQNKSCDWIEHQKNTWYEKLRNDGYADYELYDTDWYFCELLACYDVYSSGYIEKIHNSNCIPKPKTILDLGCGLGVTSNHLRDAYGCAIIGTNIEKTKQFNFCKDTIDVYEDHRTVGAVDMIFASEYFEHIYNAGDHLQDLIVCNKPQTIVMANAFTASALGHFDAFYNGTFSVKNIHCDTMIECSNMSRLFSAILKYYGYAKLQTGFWNSRPNVYVKK